VTIELREALYRRVEIDEPCEFVGIHPLRWTERVDPTAAFITADGTEMDALWRVIAALHDRYPNEVDELLEIEGLELA